jgi:hypothetical protein
VKDLKESLSSGRKPDTTHVRTPLKVYTARGCEYGDRTQGGKYERANYLRPTGSVKGNFERLRGYLRAAVSHIEQTLDAMEMHQSTDPDLLDEDGMRTAAYAIDTDAKPGCPVGASHLPHLCGAAASLNMAITQAVTYGLLPADPGQPWRERESAYHKVMDAPTVTLITKGEPAPVSDRVWTLDDLDKNVRALIEHDLALADARVAAGAYDVVEVDCAKDACRTDGSCVQPRACVACAVQACQRNKRCCVPESCRSEEARRASIERMMP